MLVAISGATAAVLIAGDFAYGALAAGFFCASPFETAADQYERIAAVGGHGNLFNGMRKYLSLFAVLITLQPAFADLVEIGFINGRTNGTNLILEYSGGRRNDMHLAPHEIALERGIPGEPLVRIYIKEDGQKAEVLRAEEIRQQAKYRGMPWLYISAHGSRVISPQEVDALRQKFRRR